MIRPVVIVDYGMGNLQSIVNAFRKIQVEALVTGDHREIRRGSKLVLPGVGAFDEGMRNLARRDLVPVLSDRVLGANVPVLGICLGLQLLTRRSEEGVTPGLGWLNADTVAVDRDGGDATRTPLRVPHMGWNTIEPRVATPLLQDLPPRATFYFAHSYRLRADDGSIIAATTSYGLDFPAVITHRNIAGTQFHPEKSLADGLQLLRNFADLS